MFFGRETEFAQLEALWKKSTSSLVTCRGRRRIGKSTLIDEFARRSNARLIKMEGIKPKPKFGNDDELASFAQQLSVQTGAETTPPSNWLNAFIRLDREIRDDVRTVVLLDEISWMGYYDRLFADTLRVVWENHWRRHPKLVVVLCGSVSSWIRDNVIDNSAFMGRRSLDIVVPELPLSECVRFWGDAASRVSTREIVDVLSVTGGVPQYLQEVDPGASADENIRRLAFTRNGLLRSDFDEMFNDVITRQSGFTEQVLRCLVSGARTCSELAELMRMERGGRISEALQQLSEAGLVAVGLGKNPETGARIRERRYRLRDNYSRFYLKMVEPVKDVIDAGSYAFASLSKLEEWNSIMGLAFENLIVNNYAELLPHLHFGNAMVTSAAPYGRAGTQARGDGFQIDLLIQTEGNLCVTEVKRKHTIGKEIIGEVDAKVRKLRRPAGVSIRTALVYDGELSPYVESNGYFDAIVPFSRLLGL